VRTRIPAVHHEGDLEKATRLLLERHPPAIVVAEARDHLVGVVSGVRIEDVAALGGLAQAGCKLDDPPSRLHCEPACVVLAGGTRPARQVGLEQRDFMTPA
jgi:hypothetical protein